MPKQPSVRLSVIIPAYNEELRLPHTLTHVLAYLKSQPYESEVLVVNDGSTDGTERAVGKRSDGRVPVRVLAHPDGANHGKGASVRLGMLEAMGEYRLFMDADNSTTLDHVERFWPFFSQGYSIVIGSRALKDSVIGLHQAWHKEFAGRLGNWFIRAFAVPGIRDTQAGFKMVTAQAAEVIFPRMTIERWGFDIELLAIARSRGCRIREVPITWINAPGSKVSMASYLQVLGEVQRIRRNLKAGRYR
jgi:glycosyltransferase involved in cell wall biosynthesis